METLSVAMLNGAIYGLLLFMVVVGLTPIFGIMGVLNFVHQSFYLLGAYFACTLQDVLGFWRVVAVAPLLVGLTRAWYRSQRSSASNGNGPRRARSRAVHKVLMINMALNPAPAGMLV